MAIFIPKTAAMPLKKKLNFNTKRHFSIKKLLDYKNSPKKKCRNTDDVF